MAHINLTREADAVLVAPASADFIAKLAQGRADELLSLLCLARPIERCPLLVAPAMNREMWAHPATQRNVAQVRADGATVLGPGGRRPGLRRGRRRPHARSRRAVRRADRLLPAQAAGRQRVLVTAGPTFEAIDPVRGITNHSSGKMGFAIARAAPRPAPQVTLVAGPVHLPTPRGVRAHRRAAARSRCTTRCCRWRRGTTSSSPPRRWPTGARPHAASRRSRRTAAAARRRSRLTENPDILAAVARLPPARPWCVGFAAESHDLARARAREAAAQGRAADRRQPRARPPSAATTTRCCWSTPRRARAAARPTS